MPRFSGSVSQFSAILVALCSLAWSTGVGAQLTTKATVIMSKRSGNCVTVKGGSASDGAEIVQARCDAAPSATFKLVPVSTHFQLVATHSGKCLAVQGGSTNESAAVVQVPCSGATSEQWAIQTTGSFYQLRARHSDMCLNVDGDTEQAGASLVQWPCSTSDNNLWSFGDGFLATGQRARLVSSGDLCADVARNSTSDNAPVSLWTCKAPASAANQSWALSRQSTGYRIAVQHSGKCLNVQGGSIADNAVVVQSPCGTGSSQTWLLQSAGGGFKLVNKKSNKCLDLAGNPSSQDTALVQNACADGRSQTFRLSAEQRLGAWSDLIELPLVPVAAAAFSNRKVLFWSAFDAFDFGIESGKTQTALFDPRDESLVSSEISSTDHEMFCPGTAMLPDGRLLVNGGSSAAQTSLYDPATGAWSAGAPMNLPRGYNADTVTDNGKVFTIGGSWNGARGGKNGELWSSATGWSVLDGAPADPMTGPDPAGVYRGDNHAWLFGTAGGRVFHAGPSVGMNWYDTGGSGSVTSAGNRSDDQYSMNGNAVMYDVNRILKVGGAPAYDDADALASSYVINLSSGVSVTKSGQMAYARALQNSVVLPDGQVLVIGGQSRSAPFSDAQSILAAELWASGSNSFVTVAAMHVPRNYHSIALLLPDARVLVGGGGLCGQCDTNHPDIQYYLPGYLFQPNGLPAARPTIVSAPNSAGFGGQISVTTNRAVSRFSLVRLGAVTHTTNNDQRRVPLTIAASSGNTYTLKTPSNAGIATPGYYMLFAIDSAGVPSVAAILRVG